MTDFHILPADPRDDVRERWRDFSTQERPGDPWAEPFDVNPPSSFPVLTVAIAVTLIGMALVGGLVG